MLNPSLILITFNHRNIWFLCKKGITTLLDLAKKENHVVVPFLNHIICYLIMNPIDIKNYTYGVYARKSSESEDKQVQSIDRQIDDFLELKKREHLRFYETPIKESKSAFSVGRDGFNVLVKLTETGQINAWLCWHANRLSRNAIDAGVIVDLLDRGKLHHIRTPSRIYFNTPTDKMMLQIEFTMSKKDSDDKSVFVKSGLKKRYKKGLPNGKAPIGFLNDKTKEKGDRDWLVDHERYKKLEMLFTKFLKGHDSLNTITDYAQNVLQLTTPKTKRQGGKLVGRSLVEHILKNPIYAGFFYSKDEYGQERTHRQLDEKVPRILTEDEHFKILNIFGERNHPNQQTHLTPYSGIIYGSDGNYMGADVKLQVICDCAKKFAYTNTDICPSCNKKIIEMKHPKYLSYTYYYNIKRKRTKGLSARSIEERKINQALIALFENELHISEPLYHWSKKYLKELQDGELEQDKKIAHIQKKALCHLEEKKAKLRELFINEIITKEEFQYDLKKLHTQIDTKKIDYGYAENWYEDMEHLLDTLFNFGEIIKKGSYGEKKEALALLSPNLIWDEQNLHILKADWLQVFIQGRRRVLEQYPVFEPKNNGNFKGLKGVLDIKCPTLLRWLDKVRKKRYKL